MADRWMLLEGGCYRQVVYSCVSGTMVDGWMLLLSGCCRQVSIIVSLVLW